MSVPVVITGAIIEIFFNNTQYKEVANITLNIDYNEYSIGQIDSPYPAEIAGGMVSVSGSVSGFRVTNSGGLQGKNMRPLFSDVSSAPYISLRIDDRNTKENLILLPQAKVSNERWSMSARGVFRLDFDFKAMVPLQALDRSSS